MIKVHVHWPWKFTATLQGHVTIPVKAYFSTFGVTLYSQLSHSKYRQLKINLVDHIFKL